MYDFGSRVVLRAEEQTQGLRDSEKARKSRPGWRNQIGMSQEANDKDVQQKRRLAASNIIAGTAFGIAGIASVGLLLEFQRTL